MLPLRDYPYQSRPMILAHRGDTSTGARENSLEAVSAALATGADMVEVDVQWTADEEFVCYHDEAVAEDGTIIWKSSALHLESLGIARLENILGAGVGKTYFNLEIKEYSARDPKRFVAALLELVRKVGSEDSALISSFRVDYIREIPWSLPTVIIHPDDGMQAFFNKRSHNAGWNAERPLADYLPSELMRVCGAAGYACQLSELTLRALEDVRKHNILLSVYTITSRAEFEHAIAHGARALVCEEPELFAALRDERFPAAVDGL